MFFCFLPITFVFLIYYLYSVVLTKMLSSSVGERRLLQALGPGFDSQVPHLFNAFFLNVLLCSFHSQDHHASSPSKLATRQGDPSNGQITHSTIHPQSTICKRAGKVKKGLILIGPNCLHIPPLRARYPSYGLHISFLF